jgi:hypothetical protein
MTPDASQERFLEARLLDWKILFCWVSDAAERKQRFRRAIIDGFIDQAIIGRNLAGKAETYAEIFERIYREPLRPERGG